MTKYNFVSLLLLTKNESENLKKNFKWLDDCRRINEIVIVDDNSTDDTIEIAKKFASKKRSVQVFNRGLAGDFAAQRNFAISKTTNNLVLWLDADEYPSKKLIRYINHIDKHQYNNYSFKRQDIFLRHTLKHGETAYLKFTRLFNKNFGNFKGQVHEKWISTKPTKEINLSIHHSPHKNLKSFIEKIDFYSTIRSKELYNQKKSTNVFEIIFFPVGKFIQNYFLRLGFLDGTPGIIMALCLSFHVFLNKSKLWHLSQR